ncbi:hypothetical protein [Sediminitomix flava]|uniref:Uncharacterized protein n=1 Tax=Sediminitomix flava TaxID=379075 RepID=A0A315ZJK0_SEDFL|nr:hypothetical protein [Sediminitomix flava]PWJ45008.1 hypothetical protein BC781_1011406 [Sediminitomix flava]
MPNQQTEHLFQLIKSLTKSEKRSFKLYAQRTSNKEGMKFIQLFDVLDKSDHYDEKVILEKTNIKKAQLSNLKAHLYKQLLTSLKLNSAARNIDMQIREQIDFAQVLYLKGLYKQSLKILDKTRQMADTYERFTLKLEVIEFEKIIEQQYITRSLRNRAEELTSEAGSTRNKIAHLHQLSNLSLTLYGIYIKAGHVRNIDDYKRVKSFFFTRLPELDPEKLSGTEKLYWYICHVWYSFIIQDFVKCYRYAQKWIELFHEHPNLLDREPEWYLKGIHYFSETVFLLGRQDQMQYALDSLLQFEERYAGKMNENLEILGFLYEYTLRLNMHFAEGTFTEGTSLAPKIEERIAQYAEKLDNHRILVFYYKIACMYFGAGDNSKCIFYLNKIISYRDTRLREDIHCFARILSLVAHFEMGNDDLVEYQVKSVYRFLGKMNDQNAVQEEIFKFLRKLGKISNQEELKVQFVSLREKLIELREDPYERRPFNYLDLISWLECKITNTPIQEVIKEKYTSHKER